jgi:hypothetical protein
LNLPDELWEEIVAVAGAAGVSRTSRALGLWYYSVKRRVAAIEGVGGTGRAVPALVAAAAPSVRFVEVAGQRFVAGDGCVIEMQRGDGARVTVRQARVEDVAIVVQSFLGVRA